MIFGFTRLPPVKAFKDRLLFIKGNPTAGIGDAGMDITISMVLHLDSNRARGRGEFEGVVRQGW